MKLLTQEDREAWRQLALGSNWTWVDLYGHYFLRLETRKPGTTPTIYQVKIIELSGIKKIIAYTTKETQLTMLFSLVENFNFNLVRHWEKGEERRRGLGLWYPNILKESFHASLDEESSTPSIFHFWVIPKSLVGRKVLATFKTRIPESQLGYCRSGIYAFTL